MSSDKVEIVNYTSDWVSLFEAECQLLKQVLGVACLAVHHMGSTSVPGMAAKPFVDIIVVVDRITGVDEANSLMENIGYQPQGEYGIPFRRFFMKRTNTVDQQSRGFNVHFYEKHNQEIDLHLLFRDWLRTHSDDRFEYEQLKRKLADKYPNDRRSYNKGKDELVAEIEKKMGFSGIRFKYISSKSEWETYHQLWKEEIYSKFDHIDYDPNHLMFKSDNSFNFGLFKGVDQLLTGILVQLLDEDRAAIRLLATVKEHQGNGYGRLAVSFIEKWIRQWGRRLILVHSIISKQEFFSKLGYQDMAFENDRCIFSDYVDVGKWLDT